MKFKDVVYWVVIPVANFVYWFNQGHQQSIREACSDDVASPIHISLKAPDVDPEPCPVGTVQNPKCEIGLDPRYSKPHIEYIHTNEFDRYRSQTLAPMNFPDDSYTIALKSSPDIECNHYLHQIVTEFPDKEQCFAVVRVSDINAEYNVLRFENDIDEAGLSRTSKEAANARKKNKNYIFNGNSHNKGKERPSGYFRKVPKERGRDRIREKMQPFLQNLEGPDGIQQQLENKLRDYGFKPGDDIVIMVVNEGEIDLYLNFACSCQQHNIPTRNILVFAASSEIVTMIESTGAMGIYHPGYGSVSRKASMDYLDRVFVDMMWYKAFSVYLLLRLRYNILFQDADLVWFKEPYSFFHDYIAANAARASITGSHVEAFLSDDGQRSMRYAPFFGNSGFYYLIGSPRSEHFTYSIMTAFDSVQVLGSHQNVFTTRLVEGLALSHKNVMILPIYDFPTGILYHHDKAYMHRLKRKKEHPYHFHMCWTQGKPDKLVYLRAVSMWYLTETCSPLEALTPNGHVFGRVSARESHHIDTRWAHLSEMCCMSMPDSP